MANTKDNYQLLIEKLDHFIRKYYLNKLIRGVLFSLGLILGLFIVISVMEYFFYFDKSVRKILFFSFLGVSIIALGYWVFNPLLHYFRLGKLISHQQAAEIIGQHFTNVKDKLLNVLQLNDQASQEAQNKALILASINQKTEEIKPVPFKKAINLNNNRKYARYALPPLLLLIILLFAAPSVIKDSTERLINNNRDFEREAPFDFIVDDQNLEVIQYQDYDLTVNVEGDVIPDEVFIDVDNYQYRLQKVDATTFKYTFNNVQKTTNFHLLSSGFKSRDYDLSVINKPNILAFDIKLDYPSYIQRKDEELKNVGDFVVPMGTNIDWIFTAENTNKIDLQFSSADEKLEAKRFSDDLFSYKKQAMKDERYKLFISNEKLKNADSIAYTLSVIPDLYPTISANKFEDSTQTKLLFFIGDAADDYGLRNLTFNYYITNEKGRKGELETQQIQKPSGKQLEYEYVWDLNEIELNPGDEVNFYFEVFDNDGINGSKSARTNLMVFAVPTLEEFEEMASANNEDIKKDLKESMEESKKIQEELKKLREKLLQEKEMDWQARKELEKLLDRQKELEKKMQNAQQKMQENMQNQEEYSQPNEELQEKQEKLEEMFEEVMSEEMKELMKEIEELLQELGKDEALEKMEEMEFNEEELEMEMDRMLELFKQLELEKELQDQIDKLEELAEEQEKLSEETEQQEDGDQSDEEGKQKQEELEKKQEEINKEFEEMQEKMEEIMEKNEELENPKSLEDPSEEMEDINEDLQDSQESLEKKQNKKASQSQKNASQKMKQMASSMQMQMQAGEMEQMQEDMQALRQLLENLVGLSFDQEDLIDYFSSVNVYTPRYTELVQQQFKLKDDFKLIEDSLRELSKRVFQIESFVTEKVQDIKLNIKESLEELEERKKPQAAEHQQRTMKNANDLALMLSEVMNQMQQQMSGMMAGSQMCNSPGGKGSEGSKPMDKITKGQQGLSEQMKQMQQQMKNGQKGGGSSKQFAEMAARQAALRKALEELKQTKMQKGDSGKELQEIIEQMDQNEIDLVNKRLTNEMLKRQQEIMTRLLEAEKAEREREFDNKRQAEQASQKERKYPPSLKEYIKKRESEIELYKQVSPSLKPYYRFLVEEYYKSLKNE